jgi:hypothetical protein
MEMRKQTDKAARATDHPPQNTTKKATRPNAADNYGAKGAENAKEVKKRSGQAPKDTFSQQLTRQETMEVPETEGEQAVFRTSARSEDILVQSRKQPLVPLERGEKRFSVEATATKLFPKQNSKVGSSRLGLERADVSY